MPSIEIYLPEIPSTDVIGTRTNIAEEYLLMDASPVNPTAAGFAGNKELATGVLYVKHLEISLRGEAQIKDGLITEINFSGSRQPSSHFLAAMLLFMKGKTILWIGQTEDIVSGSDEGTVLGQNYLCRKLLLVKPGKHVSDIVEALNRHVARALNIYEDAQKMRRAFKEKYA